jgi:hypothetical protein
MRRDQSLQPGDLVTWSEFARHIGLTRVIVGVWLGKDDEGGYLVWRDGEIRVSYYPDLYVRVNPSEQSSVGN